MKILQVNAICSMNSRAKNKIGMPALMVIGVLGNNLKFFLEGSGIGRENR